MAHQSPFTEAISRPWHQLTFEDIRVLEDGRTPHPERIAKWQTLYELATEDGRWTVSAADASLVAGLGVTLALQSSRFAEAAALAQQFLDHPDALDDPISWAHLSIRLGIAQILDGRLEEGIQVLDVLRNDKQGHVNIRGDLLHALADLGEAADSRMSAFVSRLLGDQEGFESQSQKALSAGTNQELIDLIRTTYPQRDPGDC